MSGLYLHIPFCARKCAYCDFLSFADPAAMPAYVRALCAEIALRGAQEAFAAPFDTVFFGGGTPSLLPPPLFTAIMRALREAFSIAPNAEITVECNPGTLDAGKLHAYADAGVNRLSLGLQSTQDAILNRIGRIHTFADFAKSWALAAAVFSNINLDVMYGLPGQAPADYKDTLQTICELSPAHISAYSLILEAGTPLYDAHPDLPDEDETYAMHILSRTFLGARGYERYEISNYAKPGYACRHNLNYWDNGCYLGLGLGAHSAWRRGGEWRRFYNTTDMRAYLAALAAGKLSVDELPVGGEETIPRKEEMFECVMLGLRKTAGLREADFLRRFGVPLSQVYPQALTSLAARALLLRAGGVVRLSERGLDLQNEALLAFMD